MKARVGSYIKASSWDTLRENPKYEKKTCRTRLFDKRREHEDHEMTKEQIHYVQTKKWGLY